MTAIAWAAVSVSVVLVGRMAGNDWVLSVGAAMLLFTCCLA